MLVPSEKREALEREVYVVAWLYEPGMELALPILFSDVRADRVQVVAASPNEVWVTGTHADEQRAYREFLIKEAKCGN